MVIWLWAGFLALVAVLIAIDLRLTRIGLRSGTPAMAVTRSAAWIAVSLAFGGLVYLLYDVGWAGLGAQALTPTGEAAPLDGRDAFLRFITAYILEAALSLDNLFVVALIFAHFRLPRSLQHAVLFYGAYAAILIRGVWIAAAAGLLAFAPWFTYALGAILLLAAVRMLTLRTDDPRPESNPAIRLVRRLYPVSPGPSGGRFFTRLAPAKGPAGAQGRRGRLAMTPLLVALLMVESADGLYALGSIPAGIAVAPEPLLLYTSNILAVLTVRSMYPALAPVLARFRYVKVSLVLLLLFAATKMFLAQHFAIAPEVSLAVVVGILCVGAAASLVSPRGERAMEPPLGHDVDRLARLTVQQARRLIILVVGLTMLAVSVPIGVLLPGPGGIPVALVGLMILATEFVWARRLLRRARQGADFAAAEAERRIGLLTKLRGARDWVGRRVGWTPPPRDGGR